MYLVDEDMIVGGYQGIWNINPENLKNADEIIFHVLDQGPASDEEKYLFLAGLESYSKNIPGPEIR